MVVAASTAAEVAVVVAAAAAAEVSSVAALRLEAADDRSRLVAVPQCPVPPDNESSRLNRDRLIRASRPPNKSSGTCPCMCDCK